MIPKIRDVLSSEQIVQICTDASFKLYCKEKYCPHYKECNNKEVVYVRCEDAMISYFDSEETEASYLLRRLEEEKDKLITFDTMHNINAMDQIDLFNDLIKYINKKESAEN